MIAFALVLFAGAAAGWLAARAAPPAARLYLRLAAVLYASLALSAVIGLAVPEVTAIVTTLGSVVLGVAASAAFRRPPRRGVVSLILCAASLAGIVAAATGFATLAAVPQVLSAAFVLAIARRRLKAWRRPGIYLSLAGISLLGTVACHMVTGLAAEAGLLMFAAAAVLGTGVASNVLVEERYEETRRLGIRRAR